MHPITLLLAASFPFALQDRGLLSGLPESAFALAYCPAPQALRDRGQANDWMQMLASDEGKPLYVDLEDQLEPWTGSSLRAPLDVGLELTGESAFFVTPAVSGLLTLRPDAPEPLLDAMRRWLGERAQGQHDGSSAELVKPRLRTAEVLGGRVELALAPNESGPVRTAAMLDHPRVLGLFTGDSEEALLLALRDALLALERDEECSLVQGFRAARAARGPLALECYVDFSPLIARAEAALAAAGQGLEIDPTGLLGLEQGTTLYLTADIQAGDLCECRGTLSLPPETLVAALADTFLALPSGLAAMLPKSAWGAIGLGWNYMAMLDRMRAALDADGQKDVGKTLDQSLEAAGAMTGVDVEGELLHQFTGTFLVFFGPPPRAEQSLPKFSIGAQASIADASAFVDAFEAVIGTALGDDATDVVPIEGQDAYIFDEGVGLSILPRNVLVCFGQPFFGEALRALLGQVHESLATGTRLEAAIAENQGACFFACLELTPFRELFFSKLHAGDSPPDRSAASRPESSTPDPFDSQLVASLRRTKSGFDLRVYTR